MFVDGDWFLGTLNRDRPLTTDPAQAVFVLRLFGRQGLCILLIVWIQTLIEHVRSASTDTCVPWDEWGRDVAVMVIWESPGMTGPVVAHIRQFVEPM